MSQLALDLIRQAKREGWKSLDFVGALASSHFVTRMFPKPTKARSVGSLK